MANHLINIIIRSSRSVGCGDTSPLRVHLHLSQIKCDVTYSSFYLCHNYDSTMLIQSPLTAHRSSYRIVYMFHSTAKWIRINDLLGVFAVCYHISNKIYIMTVSLSHFNIARYRSEVFQRVEKEFV